MKLDANLQIRVLLTQKHLNLTKFAQILTEKTGKKWSKQSLSNRLRAGTIRYDEMLVIADILGYEISFSEKKS